MGFIIFMIIFNVPFLSFFFCLSCSCFVCKVWVVLLDEFSQYKYSTFSFQLFLLPVSQLEISLHGPSPPPTVNYYCLLLCTRIIFGLGFSYRFFCLNQPDMDEFVPLCLGFGNMVFLAFQCLISMTVKHCLIFVVHFGGRFLPFKF